MWATRFWFPTDIPYNCLRKVAPTTFRVNTQSRIYRSLLSSRLTVQIPWYFSVSGAQSSRKQCISSQPHHRGCPGSTNSQTVVGSLCSRTLWPTTPNARKEPHSLARSRVRISALRCWTAHRQCRRTKALREFSHNGNRGFQRSSAGGEEEGHLARAAPRNLRHRPQCLPDTSPSG